jgi:predicted amidohydrolase
MEPKQHLRLAMAQMRVEWGASDRNLDRAASMIAGAAQQGAQAALLPECLDVGWTHPDAARLAEPIPGPRSDALARAARREGLWVVAGLTERDGEEVYNTAVLLSPAGRVALKHRKINILEIAQPFYAVGDRLGVAQTPMGRVGVSICADNFPDSLDLARALGRMGARALLSPCAWAVDADHDNEREPYGGMWRRAYGEVAGQFEMAVVGVSGVGWIRGGPWEGRKCIGCSLAVGPDGRVLAEGPYGEEAEALLLVELGLSALPVKGTALSGWLSRQKGGAR